MVPGNDLREQETCSHPKLANASSLSHTHDYTLTINNLGIKPGNRSANYTLPNKKCQSAAGPDQRLQGLLRKDEEWRWMSGFETMTSRLTSPSPSKHHPQFLDRCYEAEHWSLTANLVTKTKAFGAKQMFRAAKYELKIVNFSKLTLEKPGEETQISCQWLPAGRSRLTSALAP